MDEITFNLETELHRLTDAYACEIASEQHENGTISDYEYSTRCPRQVGMPAQPLNFHAE